MATLEEILALSAEKLRDLTLEELREIRSAMVTAEWDAAVAAQPVEKRKLAALAQLNVGQAIRKIENTTLSTILQKLEANRAALAEGVAALQKSREDLKKVTTVLKAVDKVLEVLPKILKFVPLLA